MTREKACQMISEFKEVFDIVRLVDVSKSLQYTMDEKGVLTQQSETCFTVWDKPSRCENCISSKAFAQKTLLTKFEFVNKDIYLVTSKYIELEGRPYMLELVSKLEDDIFFGAYDKGEFTKKIVDYGNKLYTDALTGVRNRTYYEEQVVTLERISAIAMLDVDHFKNVNDTYGHQAGDEALKKVAECVRGCVRASDIVVRYGGDEFVLVFVDISFDVFSIRLEQIRQTIEQAVVEGYEMRLSASIGGYYTNKMSKDTIKRADELLYEAKKTRNSIKVAKELSENNLCRQEKGTSDGWTVPKVKA